MSRIMRSTVAVLLFLLASTGFAQPRPTATRPGTAPQPGVRQSPGRPSPGRPTAARPSLATPSPVARATPTPNQPMRKASELINRQAAINISRGVYDSLTPDQARVVVSLSKQRAYLLRGDEVAIDSPISSGKRAGMTPTGRFSVLEKDKDHRSSVYGDFKDRNGRTVRSGVSLKIDSAPSGTHYVG